MIVIAILLILFGFLNFYLGIYTPSAIEKYENQLNLLTNNRLDKLNTLAQWFFFLEGIIVFIGGAGYLAQYLVYGSICGL